LSARSVISESLHVLESGSQVQNAIYLAGGSEWPLSPEEWERRASETLAQAPFDYVAGGAGSEATVRANREAFERRRLRPRMLAGHTERELSIEVLGLRSAAPFLLGPVGVLSIVHAEAELGVARASKATGVPMILSSAASTPLEDVAAELGEAQRWFQLYWWSDRELAGSLVDRAAAAGYGAIVVTLDTLTLGWRDRDLRNGYLPFLQGEGLAQFFSDPLFRERLDAPPEEDLQTASLMALAAFPNLGLAWSDLAWLRERTTLPIVLKGVLTAEDARLALDHGVDGIVVSNHGGRQVDGAVASLDALVEVRDEIGPDATVLMDGGIRRGADVLKAMALGADGVLLGRLYAYGLAVGGAAGVEAVIRQLAAEVDLTLALAGGRSVRELDRTAVS
jgi:lactate 2-monooxygenase